jgi:hypothetical protein
LLTVTANAASKTYDGLAYTGGNGVTYAGFVNSEAESVLAGTPIFGGTAQGAINAGSFNLAVGGLASGNYDIQFVGKVKTALFGGEGLFFATLRGPGKVWLQSLPLSRLADRIYKAAPQTGRRTEEGSLLGGIGDLLDGR